MVMLLMFTLKPDGINDVLYFFYTQRPLKFLDGKRHEVRKLLRAESPALITISDSSKFIYQFEFQCLFIFPKFVLHKAPTYSNIFAT